MNFNEILKDIERKETQYKNIEDFIEKRDKTEKRFYIDKTHIIGLGTKLSTEFSKIVNSTNIEDNYMLVDSFEYETIYITDEPKVKCIELKSKNGNNRLYVDEQHFSDILFLVKEKCKLFISKYEWRPLLIKTELKDEQDQTYYFAIAPVYPED